MPNPAVRAAVRAARRQQPEPRSAPGKGCGGGCALMGRRGAREERTGDAGGQNSLCCTSPWCSGHGCALKPPVPGWKALLSAGGGCTFDPVTHTGEWSQPRLKRDHPTLTLRSPAISGSAPSPGHSLTAFVLSRELPKSSFHPLLPHLFFYLVGMAVEIKVWIPFGQDLAKV